MNPLRIFCRPAEADSPLLLVFTSPQDRNQELLFGKMPPGVSLLAVDEADWEGSFTPWPAPAVFKGAAAFGGGADAYLCRLAGEVLPDAEAGYGLRPVWRGVAGYSLAGLLAAYCAYRMPLFDRLACVSGSLWFDGWGDFVRREPLAYPPERAYFSIGGDEDKARNPRLARVARQMGETCAMWRQAGVPVMFETNPGGHFNDVPGRLGRAAEWLMRENAV
ncbi:MAG: alpha/beta hydrolase-fold protein [Neisseria sp.]|nr:alpha/beta hydrolase-fold protein [Neisseria sp.]